MIEFDDELKKLVNFQKLGYVATVSSDGTPNLSPKGTIAILDDSRLVFANIRSPKTIENLTNNPSIEINVIDPFSRMGYRFKGLANILSVFQFLEDVEFPSLWLLHVETAALAMLLRSFSLAYALYTM